MGFVDPPPVRKLPLGGIEPTVLDAPPAAALLNGYGAAAVVDAGTAINGRNGVATAPGARLSCRPAAR